MKTSTRSPISGDIFGGLTAMLVALPSAIAYALIVFAPLGSEFTGQAAFAGIVGTIALGLVAGVFGGTPRLISAPCAPAAAVRARTRAQSCTHRDPKQSAHMHAHEHRVLRVCCGVLTAHTLGYSQSTQHAD
jgi:MFS superfamily sulfate permease-like transporter